MRGILRTGPLTWGQHIFWYWSNPWSGDASRPMPLLRLRLALPEGTTNGRLQRALADCASRFEALRTVYSKPDTGPPRQQVLAHYEPPVLDAAGADGVPFDLTERPGLRCVVQREGDRIARADLIAYSIDLDGFSIGRVRRLIEHRAAYGRWPDGFDPATDPATRTHPIDCARQESARHGRLNQRSLRWMSELRRGMPRNLLAVVRDPATEPATGMTTMRSPRLLAGVERLADRHQVSPESVLHAAIAVLVAGWTGRRTADLTTAVANRWRPDARHVVGRVASVVGCRVPVNPDEPLAALLRRTSEVLRRAYWHGSRDYGACRLNGVREDATFGSLRSGMVVVEYLSFLRDDPSRHGSIVEHEVSTEVRPGGFPDLRFDLAPLWPGMQVTLTADLALLAPAAAARLLGVLASLVQRAADRPGLTVAELLAEVPAREPAGDQDWLATDWLATGESRFSAGAIRDLLLGYESIEHAAVFADPDEGSSLRAYVAGPAADLVGLHEHMLIGASANPLIRVPSVYRWRRHPPAGPASGHGGERAWERDASQQFIPLRDYRSRVRGGERLDALLSVFRDCHAGAPAEPARSYAENGGEYLMIPSMIRLLSARGYEGARPSDFVGLASLAAAAGQLRRTAPAGPAPTTPAPTPAPEPEPTTPDPAPTTPAPAPTTPAPGVGDAGQLRSQGLGGRGTPTAPAPAPTTPDPAPTTPADLGR